VEQEDNKSKKEKKKTVEQPELTLPQLIRVVKENPSKEEKTWKDRKMNGESIVNMMIASDGSVDAIFINMDSNLVKKLLNKKGVDIERVKNQYLTSVYSHSLMIYTTMYVYFASLLMSDEEFVD
jgi:hypothetical protein